jgi:hypothetical protein
MKTTRKELYEFKKAFTGIIAACGGPMFIDLIGTNLDAIQTLLSVFEKNLAKSEYGKFMAERNKIAEEYAIKQSGKPMVRRIDNNIVYDIDPKRYDGYNQELISLSDKYKKAIDEHNTLMNETIEVKLLTIKLSLFPENVPGKFQYVIRNLIIKENDTK